ncbi:hypothetical protein AWC38_SpisGene17429 [Stylophora pistillata]|uniref:Uncharacterized protein n=1 Tax=Stylophora pistillata TaxID=50429 RepID=A0A2B4RIJ5_STYPI|nr:hypothetical protein AWC38_SpisGene17429 [Stylophora pistillata]
MKLANRHTAYKKLKEQMQKILALRDSPETETIRTIRTIRVDAAAKAAKLQAEMEFLEKERELRRSQIGKELAIASAEESAIKRVLEQERISGDKDLTSGEGVKQELKSDVGVQTI